MVTWKDHTSVRVSGALFTYRTIHRYFYINVVGKANITLTQRTCDRIGGSAQLDSNKILIRTPLLSIRPIYTDSKVITTRITRKLWCYLWRAIYNAFIATQDCNYIDKSKKNIRELLSKQFAELISGAAVWKCSSCWTVIFKAMLKDSGCFLVQDLVTALPLANGHGSITSHFGESVRQTHLILIGFVVVAVRMPHARSCSPHSCWCSPSLRRPYLQSPPPILSPLAHLPLLKNYTKSSYCAIKIFKMLILKSSDISTCPVRGQSNYQLIYNLVMTLSNARKLPNQIYATMILFSTQCIICLNLSRLPESVCHYHNHLVRLSRP